MPSRNVTERRDPGFMRKKNENHCQWGDDPDFFLYGESDFRREHRIKIMRRYL